MCSGLRPRNRQTRLFLVCACKAEEEDGEACVPPPRRSLRGAETVAARATQMRFGTLEF
jgi:hypothetical protein